MTVLYSYTGTGNLISQNALQPQAWPITLTDSGPLNQVTIRSGLAGRNFKCAWYSHNGGSAGGTERPLNLLSTSATYTSTASGDIVVTMPTPPGYVAGDKVFFVVVTATSGNWMVAGPDAVFRVRGNNLASFSDPFPSTWTTSVAGSVSAARPYLIVESTQVSISTITPVVSGQAFTLTLSDTSYAATSVTFSDALVSKTVAVTSTGTPGQFTGVGPSPSDEQTMLRVGSINVTATNGTTPTTTSAVGYAIASGHPDNATPVDFTTVTYTSIAPGNIGALFGFDPPLKIGGQCSFDPARGIAYVDGTQDFYDYTGETRYIYRDPDTGICNFWDVETINGTPVTPGDENGLTSTGLTSTGLTSTGLIARGL